MAVSRWGIRKRGTRYEVWGRMLQFHAECQTELDAKTVLLACLTRYEGVTLRPEDVHVTESVPVLQTDTWLRSRALEDIPVTEEAGMTKPRTATVVVFYEESGRSYGLELELQGYPPVPTRQPTCWPAPDDVPLDPDIMAATLIEIDERKPTPDEVQAYGLAWVTDRCRQAKILESAR